VEFDFPVRDVALLAIGAMLTVLGGIVSDSRKDAYRRRAKFEEACLEWLNAQAVVLGRLKILSEVALEEPKSMAAHEELLQNFAFLAPDLKKLNEALNAAILYNRSWVKGALLQRHSTMHIQLHKMLQTILAHHRTHLKSYEAQEKYKAYIAEVCELESRVMSPEEESVQPSDVQERIRSARSRIAQAQKEMETLTQEREASVATCRTELLVDAKALHKTIADIEQETPALRRRIAAQWI